MSTHGLRVRSAYRSQRRGHHESHYGQEEEEQRAEDLPLEDGSDPDARLLLHERLGSLNFRGGTPADNFRKLSISFFNRESVSS